MANIAPHADCREELGYTIRWSKIRRWRDMLPMTVQKTLWMNRGELRQF